MIVAYIICRAVVNLTFIAASLFLSVYTGNYNFLWFLCVPIFSHLTGPSVEGSSGKSKQSQSKSVADETNNWKVEE